MSHCAGCGRPSSDCPGCLSPIDPPHYCTTCGQWLRVQVTTTGWTAFCRPCAATTVE